MARKETNVLVHCMVGVSRSVTIVAAYLIKKYKYSLKDVFNTLQRKRSKVMLSLIRSTLIKALLNNWSATLRRKGSTVILMSWNHLGNPEPRAENRIMEIARALFFSKITNLSLLIWKTYLRLPISQKKKWNVIKRTIESKIGLLFLLTTTRNMKKVEAQEFSRWRSWSKLAHLL